VLVTCNIAPKIANANQVTNKPASKIASGSIHFVRLAREYSTSFSYCALIFLEIFSKLAVFSHTDNICVKSEGKYIFLGSISFIDSTIGSHFPTFI
jgi:hypothetical protein